MTQYEKHKKLKAQRNAKCNNFTVLQYYNICIDINKKQFLI